LSTRNGDVYAIPIKDEGKSGIARAIYVTAIGGAVSQWV
jgi:hypothetical protein